jgi:hypothetical protein
MHFLCHVELVLESELELFYRVVKAELLAGGVEVDTTYCI